MGAHVPRLAANTCNVRDWRVRFSSLPLFITIRSENDKKNTKCSITLEELINKINKWNLKYGFVVESVDTSDSKPDIERCASSTLAEVTNVIRGEIGIHA